MKHAMRSETVTCSAFRCGGMNQPITCRLNRSMMTARLRAACVFGPARQRMPIGGRETQPSLLVLAWIT
ncbi:hypothetical protein BX592_115122 [Paraburkholderia rhizosphaerae]|uniref:Uncharacterized protein n=1 Tax=Paraburkholderia rhizosphaerae TaxID=480658 RepID=A0A4V3HE79_9BURK|nr:hypothetical protein BX592_115122 [Paraburkholderia rhizosphaerae]